MQQKMIRYLSDGTLDEKKVLSLLEECSDLHQTIPTIKEYLTIKKIDLIFEENNVLQKIDQLKVENKYEKNIINYDNFVSCISCISC